MLALIMSCNLHIIQEGSLVFELLAVSTAVVHDFLHEYAFLLLYQQARNQEVAGGSTTPTWCRFLPHEYVAIYMLLD